VNDHTRSQRIYERSLAVILENQQPGGAFLACPTMPDYQFSWFRDGAYIAYALTVDGQAGNINHAGSMAAQTESARAFHDWCARVINHEAAGLERCIERASRGEPLVLADALNARYRADGETGPDDWPEFQLDGAGTWLWSLAEYVDRTHTTPLPLAWEQAVTLTARYLAALWQMPCYDCWEERGKDLHISTLGAIYAGLKAAQLLVPSWDFGNTALAIHDFVLGQGLTPGSELAKSVGLDMVDANLISVAVPHGLLKPDDPVMQQTIARIERELHAPQSGIHRHLEDVYYGGGVWVLLALWLAWYYLEVGDRQRADELITWAENQADGEGNLPEQVPHPMLASVSHYDEWVMRRGSIAQPLLWSHAQYIIVRRTLIGS
jgi:GH15 family glucan-1,4-alpha-glucosidase